MLVNEHFQNPEILGLIYQESDKSIVTQIAGLQAIVTPTRLLGTRCAKVYCPERAGEGATLELFKEADRRGLVYVAVSTCTDLPDLKGLHPISDPSEGTYVIDLSVDAADLWKALGSKTRNMVRKGEKNKLRIETTKDESHLERWYGFYRTLYSEETPVSIETLRRMLAADAVTFFAVFSDDEIISGAMIIAAPNPYFFVGATRSGGGKLAPNHLLHWHIIKHYQNQGAEFYDLGGTSRVTEKQARIDSFKKSLGGDFVAIKEYHVNCYNLGARIYNFAKRLAA